jgi:hypothetical protein
MTRLRANVCRKQFQGPNQIGETELKDKLNNYYLAFFDTSTALASSTAQRRGATTEPLDLTRNRVRMARIR